MIALIASSENTPSFAISPRYLWSYPSKFFAYWSTNSRKILRVQEVYKHYGQPITSWISGTDLDQKRGILVSIFVDNFYNTPMDQLNTRLPPLVTVINRYVPIDTDTESRSHWHRWKVFVYYFPAISFRWNDIDDLIAWLWPYEETKRKCARSWASQLR
jgi:hypothetical protein